MRAFKEWRFINQDVILHRRREDGNRQQRPRSPHAAHQRHQAQRALRFSAVHGAKNRRAPLTGSPRLMSVCYQQVALMGAGMKYNFPRRTAIAALMLAALVPVTALGRDQNDKGEHRHLRKAVLRGKLLKTEARRGGNEWVRTVN